MTRAAEDRTRDVLVEACGKAGLPAHPSAPIRLAENHLWRLPGRVVARIARPGQWDAAVREVAVARWLSDNGMSVAEPLDAVDQPIAAAGRPVTFWREFAPHRQGTYSDMAPILKRLHALPVPERLPLGDLDPLVRLEDRISGVRHLAEHDRQWLLKRVADLGTAWAGLPEGLPRSVVHGDAWIGNVAITDAGTSILHDFERTSVGPPEWDLTSTAIKLTSFSLLPADVYAAFCTDYGFDVTEWAGYPVLRDIREMRIASFGLLVADDDPAMRDEARFRIDCLRGRCGPRPWSWKIAG